MKISYLSLLLGSALLLGGCGSDDDNNNGGGEVMPPPPPPPVETPSLDIGEASSIELTLNSFNPDSGEVIFVLQNAEGKALTNAAKYRITYFGYPAEEQASTKPKAWKRWHVTYSYSCDPATECPEPLRALDDVGSYSFSPSGLDWDADAANGAVSRYKVAIEVFGTELSNEITLLSPTNAN
ncbi:hypothetical protein ACRTDR_06355 [Shewanella algae]